MYSNRAKMYTSGFTGPPLEIFDSLVRCVTDSLKYKVTSYEKSNGFILEGDLETPLLFKWKGFVLGKRRRNVRTPTEKRIGNVIRYSRKRIGFDYLEQNNAYVEFIGGNRIGTYIIHATPIENDKIQLTIHFTDQKIERKEKRESRVREITEWLAERERRQKN